jgi:hypothetical protein
MLRDPCRRFAFGLTIEAHSVRFFFFSRAFMFRTIEFDINKVYNVFFFLYKGQMSYMCTQGYQHLIKFFAGIAIGTDEQLGWDPTITRYLTPDNRIQYRIKVAENLYQTFGKPLANFRANDVVGRGTRAFRVHLVTNEGDVQTVDTKNVYVLKDIWINRTETQEAITIKTILHALRCWKKDNPNAPDASSYADNPTSPHAHHDVNQEWFKAPKNDPTAFDEDAPSQFSDHQWGTDSWDKYFPCVVEHGNVKFETQGEEVVDSIRNLMKDNAYDDLSKLHLRTYDTSPREPLSKAPQPAHNSASTHTRSSGNPVVPIDPQRRQRKGRVARQRDAVHYRIVFKHVGKRMDELPYLSQVYAGLRDASIGELPMRHSPSSMLTQHVALRWLALIGYIHRDISVGNILVVTLMIEGKEEC